MSVSIAEELHGIDLGDQRLNKRVIKLLDCFAANPTGSIPQACGGWTDTVGAYRLLAHESVDQEKILGQHYQCSLARAESFSVVLAMEDTTELDYNGQKIKGLGRLNYDSQRGLYLHPTYLVTPDRVPLGLINVQKIVRGETKAADQQKTDLPKESERWVTGYEQLAEKAEQLPHTQLVYVADREGDMIEVMQKAHELDYAADWLIRSQHNRVLYQDNADAPKQKLYEATLGTEPIVTIEFKLKSRRAGKGKTARKARLVQQTLYAERIMIPDGNGGKLDVSCLIAHEENPPAGEDPIVWRLLTNRLIQSVEDAVQLIEWYRARWEQEMFFDILKNGCKVETLQLGTLDGIERALSLYLIVTWRIAYLMRMGRACPNMDARLLFDADEIEAVYLISKQKVPDKPELNDVILRIAKLGGFLARKSDGFPGSKSIWIGMQQLTNIIIGIQAARYV